MSNKDNKTHDAEKAPRKRRILVVAPGMEFDKSTVGVIDENCRAFAQLGYAVTLLEPFGKITAADADELEDDQIDGYRRLKVHGWSKAKQREAIFPERAEGLMLRVLDQIKPDLVDVQHSSVFGVGIVQVIQNAGYCVKVTLHDYWLFLQTEYQPFNATEQDVQTQQPWSQQVAETAALLNNRAEQVVAVSRAIYQCALEHGVNQSKLELQQSSTSLVDRLCAMPLTKRPIDILRLNFAYIGPVNKHSGLVQLFDALPQLNEAIGFQTLLNIYSDGVDDAYLQRLNIEHGNFGAIKVKHIDTTPLVQDILAKSDVLILPTRVDCGYQHLIEYALAAKVPVICSRFGSFTEHFMEYIQGRFIEPDDVDSIVRVLNDVIDHPKSIYNYQINIRRPRVWSEWAIAEYMRTCLLLGDPVEPTRVVKNLDVRAGELAQKEQEKKLYHQWLDKHSLREVDGQFMAERMAHEWSTYPLFQLIIPVREGEDERLAATITSLEAQLYNNWAVLIVASKPAPGDIFNQSEILRWAQVPSDDLIMAGVNEAVTKITADWVVLVEPGAEIDPILLYSCGDYINLHPEWNLIYVDEDEKRDNDQINPKFKPDINLDMIRSYNYIGNWAMVRAYVLQSFGGYCQTPGVATHELVLKTLDYCGEQAIGHIENILLHTHVQDAPAISNNAIDRGTKHIIEEHLLRNQIAATVYDGLLAGVYRVVYHHETQPLVSIIIPNKDMIKLFKACIESIFAMTTYQNFEIIVVDNQSEAEDTFDYYDEIKHKYPHQVRIMHYPHPFNFSAMNNMAVAEAQGEYVLMLNNDVQIIQDTWLERMVAHAQRPEVGIVGVRLLSLDKRVQHAGVILGMRDIAGHIYSGASIDAPGHMNRAQIDQNMSCVTAACMIVRKSIYEEVGGFDAIDLKVQYNDVDLNLKVLEKGYKIVWTPYVSLIHHGSVSQITYKTTAETSRDTHEKDIMLTRWLPQLKSDKAFNRNLCLSDTRSIFEPDFEVSWDPNVKSELKVLGFPSTIGPIGEHRMFSPFRNLNANALIDCAYLPPFDKPCRIPTLVEMERWNPDSIFLQTTVTDAHLNFLRRAQKHSRVFKIFDLEDLKSNIPDKNSQKAVIFPEIKRRIREALSYCDRLTVTTEPIKQAYQSMIDDIQVVPIYLERGNWGWVKSLRRQSDKPRVGWVGAPQHLGDLELLYDVVKQTCKQIDWVFMGMCPEELQPYVAESHGCVLFEDYPKKMASLNLDLAVAPLEQHPFNEAKSHLRLLEYGAMGWPVVCSDLEPYRYSPVQRVKNNTKDWVEAILERTHDLDFAAKEGDILKKWTLDNWMLEDHLDVWLNALTPNSRFDDVSNENYHAL